jgi:hypothetical protein
VEDKKGKTAATLFGKWDDSLHYIIGGHSGKGKGSNSSKPHMLWKRNQLPEQQTRYNLTEFALTLNEITPGLKVIVSIKRVNITILDNFKNVLFKYILYLFLSFLTSSLLIRQTYLYKYRKLENLEFEL